MEEIIINKKLSLSDKVKYFFKKPSILFEQYIENPKYSLTFLIFIIATAIYSVSYSIGCKDYIINMVEKRMQGISQPQALEIAKSVATNPIILSVSSIVTAIISVYLLSLLYFLVAKFSDKKISFKRIVSIYCLSSITISIGLIIKSMLLLIMHKPILDNSSNPTLVSTLLNYVDPFSIWQYVLLIIGISTVGKTSKKESSFIVIVGIIISISISLFMLALKLKSN